MYTITFAGRDPMAAKVIVYIEIFLDIWVKSGDLIDFIRGHAAYIELQIIGETVPVGIIFPIRCV